MSNIRSKNIGFIGMGLMGVPMSIRLHEAGYEVTVWNRTKAKCDAPQRAGLQVANSIAELVEQSDIVMSCLTNTDAVEAVVLSNEFLNNASSTKVLVDFSSVDPVRTKSMAKALFEKTQMPWIDCPVSGGVAGAESGKLVMMAGGDASCNVLVMAEALAMMQKAGVDAEKIPAALADGFADSIPLQLTGQRMVEADFEELKWHIKTLAKDLNMSVDLSENSQASTPMAKFASQLMNQYCEQGFADLDPANLIKLYQ